MHSPVCSTAITQSSPGDGKAGKTSQRATPTLHKGRPSAPRFNSSIFRNSGGSYAGWNAGNLSLQVLQVNNTVCSSIMCTANTACKGISFRTTSNLGTLTGRRAAGTIKRRLRSARPCGFLSMKSRSVLSRLPLRCIDQGRACTSKTTPVALSACTSGMADPRSSAKTLKTTLGTFMLLLSSVALAAALVTATPSPPPPPSPDATPRGRTTCVITPNRSNRSGESYARPPSSAHQSATTSPGDTCPPKRSERRCRKET